MKAKFLNDLWQETTEFALIILMIVLGCLVWYSIDLNQRIEGLEYLEARVNDLELEVRWKTANNLKRR